jgi:hypothetical protein
MFDNSPKCLITITLTFHSSERTVCHIAASTCAVVNLGFCLLVRGCTNSKRNQWPNGMGSACSDVVKGVLTSCMVTSLISIMWDQDTHGLLWNSEVSYTCPELVGALVLALVGLVVVVVFWFMLLYVQIQCLCVIVTGWYVFVVCLIMSVSQPLQHWLIG